MSNQANSNVEWKQAQNFFARDVHLLTVEERDLLEDWELVLCEMSTLETVAFLPRLQRCFQRVESFFTEQGGALQKVGARNLQLALRSPHMLQFPTATFARVFVERYLESFTPEQSEVISVWEAQLCQISAEAQERARRSCAQAFLRLQEFFCKVCKGHSWFAEGKLEGCGHEQPGKQQRRVEASAELFCSWCTFADSRRKRLAGRLGIGSLRDVHSGDCGFSAPSPEMLPTCWVVFYRARGSFAESRR